MRRAITSDNKYQIEDEFRNFIQDHKLAVEIESRPVKSNIMDKIKKEQQTPQQRAERIKELIRKTK